MTQPSERQQNHNAHQVIRSSNTPSNTSICLDTRICLSFCSVLASVLQGQIKKDSRKYAACSPEEAVSAGLGTEILLPARGGLVHAHDRDRDGCMSVRSACVVAARPGVQTVCLVPDPLLATSSAG
jgi:hypothetical protein